MGRDREEEEAPYCVIQCDGEERLTIYREEKRCVLGSV